MTDKVVRLPEELHRRLKAAAAEYGLTLADFTKGALEYYLNVMAKSEES